MADALIEFMGGSPSGIRWKNGANSIPESYRWDPQKPRYSGGNYSTADFLAEAFSWMVHDPSEIPQPDILLWLQSAVSLIGN